VALFGCSGLIGRHLAVPASVITCVRSLVAGAVLGAGWWWWKRRRQPGGVVPTGPFGALDVRLVAGGGLLALHWWSFFAAVQGGSVALGLLTFASYPLFATLLEPLLFRERLRLADLAGCAGVAAGLVLVVPEWGGDSPTGRAAASGVFSGFTFALLSLLNRHLLRKREALMVVAVETGAAGLVMLPFVAGGLGLVSGRDWVWLGVLGVVFTGLAHWAFTAALAHVRVRVAGVTSALEPVYGIACAWLLLGEPLAGRMLAGGVLILGATLLATATRTPAGPVPSQPG
jgi:drug/metabolite transporter (DMT)-like permease